MSRLEKRTALRFTVSKQQRRLRVDLRACGSRASAHKGAAAICGAGGQGRWKGKGAALRCWSPRVDTSAAQLVGKKDRRAGSGRGSHKPVLLGHRTVQYSRLLPMRLALSLSARCVMVPKGSAGAVQPALLASARARAAPPVLTALTAAATQKRRRAAMRVTSFPSQRNRRVGPSGKARKARSHCG